MASQGHWFDPGSKDSFCLGETEGAERAGCIERGASRESGEDELGGRRRGCLCSAQSVSSTPLSSQLLQLLALR